MTETWKPIVGMETHYEVSDHGQVRSLHRKIVVRKISRQYTRWEAGKILKQKIDRYGYPAISLNFKGKKIHTTIHRLVAQTFLERDLERNCVNHKDGNKKNNHVSNLEWSSVSENNAHRVKVLGVNFAKGDRLPHTVLKESDVLKIKKILKENPKANQGELARQFGTSSSNISAIKRGESWTHVIVT